jgi:hypothetical protein
VAGVPKTPRAHYQRGCILFVYLALALGRFQLEIGGFESQVLLGTACQFGWRHSRPNFVPFKDFLTTRTASTQFVIAGDGHLNRIYCVYTRALSLAVYGT